MKVIICGAGRVGYGIASRLAKENNMVTVVDLSAELIRDITLELDVRGIVGNGAHPEVLKRAGADTADMIIAVTYSDEVNMIACQVAHSLFKTPSKVARVRAQQYLESEWNDLYSRENMPIDIIISPEIEIGKAILRRLSTPGALDVVPFADGRVQMIAVKIEEDCPIVNVPSHQISELFTGLHSAVLVVKRDDEVFVPKSDDPLNVGDTAYFMTRTEHAGRLLEIVGARADKARHIVIIGAGNVGSYVARDLEKVSGVRVRVIEIDQAVAEKKTVILNGDAMREEIQGEAGVADAEMVLCLTNDDKINILAGVLAKKMGARRAGSLINDMSMQALNSELKIDMVIDPRASTVSSILRHMRRGRIIDVFSIENGRAEIIEGEVLDSSPLVGKVISEIVLEDGMAIGAVLHDGQVRAPQSDKIIKIGDQVVLVAEPSAMKSVEQMFRASSEFF